VEGLQGAIVLDKMEGGKRAEEIGKKYTTLAVFRISVKGQRRGSQQK